MRSVSATRASATPVNISRDGLILELLDSRATISDPPQGIQQSRVLDVESALEGLKHAICDWLKPQSPKNHLFTSSLRSTRQRPADLNLKC